MAYFGPTLFSANQYCRSSVCKVIQNAVNQPKYRNYERKTGKTHFTLASHQLRTWIYFKMNSYKLFTHMNASPITPPFYCCISPNSV